MEECEALCDKLGILINGQLECYGTIPNLKKKYGAGYRLIIKLNHDDNIDFYSENLDRFIRTNIPNVILEGKSNMFILSVFFFLTKPTSYKIRFWPPKIEIDPII